MDDIHKDNENQRIVSLEELINSAKELIQKGKAAKQVAIKVGFEDYSDFSELFRRMEGMTPSEYAYLNKSKRTSRIRKQAIKTNYAVKEPKSIESQIKSPFESEITQPQQPIPEQITAILPPCAPHNPMLPHFDFGKKLIHTENPKNTLRKYIEVSSEHPEPFYSALRYFAEMIPPKIKTEGMNLILGRFFGDLKRGKPDMSTRSMAHALEHLTFNELNYIKQNLPKAIEIAFGTVVAKEIYGE